MSPVKIGFNSYVDIATNMALQDPAFERAKCTMADDTTFTTALASLSDWRDSHLDIHSPDALKSEWSVRIQKWQDEFPDGGSPVSAWTSLEHFQFGALFLQRPLWAMSLWNVRQAFYALDRLVCCKSRADLERVTKWESMPTFAYLEATNVEKWWRASLHSLGKEIQDDEDVNQNLASNPSIFGVSNQGLKDRLKIKRKEQALRRMPEIFSGITKLEDAQKELRRSWKANLESVQIMDLMLEKVSIASERRFSMINNYLKMGKNGKCVNNGSEDGDTQTPPEPEPVKPFKRSDSFDRVKNELKIAWISTERGDASPVAIAILLLILGCLHSLRHNLIAVSETGYVT